MRRIVPIQPEYHVRIVSNSIELLDCPMLIAHICEKKAAPPTTTQNVEMMRSEPCDDEHVVNMVMRSSIAIREVNGKTNMEARERFMGVSTRGSTDRPKLDREPSMLTTLLETCIKLLHDNKVVRGLEGVINKCMRWGEPHTIWKVGRHASWMGQEMQLTTRIGDYEIGQVILDLSPDANVLP